MTPTQLEAALRLINALPTGSPPVWTWVDKAVTLLRELASEPQSAHVVAPNNNEVICPACAHQFRAIPINVQALLLAAGIEPPFTEPPQRQPLTDEQIIEIGVECGFVSEGYWSEASIEFARAVERAHGIGEPT